MPACFRVGERRWDAFDRIEHEEQTAEVRIAEQLSNRRHQDAFDERGHDLAECGADDDADGKVDDVAARDELAEFLSIWHQ